ncbi:serine protease easter [Ceratitis capitata]|uniref:serine protease easter n=1 Tax=Ceratitis capitata TaxID=7213 RepID=UPI000329FCA5|nr:serine protease easter [Ceratitis capitata]
MFSFNRLHLFLFCVFNVLICVFGASDDCPRPNDEIGVCVYPKNCPSLYAIAKKPGRTEAELSHLINSICYYSDTEYKFCCSKGEIEEKDVEECITPDGNVGTCIDAQKCGSLMDLIVKPVRTAKEDNHLRSSIEQCKNTAETHNICCPKTAQREFPKDPIDKVNQTCLTTNGENGVCTTLANCPPLSNTLQIDPRSQQAKFQYFSEECEGTGELVCCPQDEDSTDNASEPPEEQPALNQPCQTPHGVNGICTILESCPPVSAIYNAENSTQEMLQFLQDSECANGSGYCCPIEQVVEQTTEATTTVAPLPEVCETVNGQNGTCISLIHCEPLMKIMQKPEFAEADVKYLNASFCGDAPNFPKVCCPPPVAEAILPQPPYCGRVSGAENDLNAAVMANSDEYPWTALLLYKNRKGQTSFYCGGTLIHERFVLTAAHCLDVERRTYNLTAVRMGAWASAEIEVCKEDQIPEEVGCAPPYIDVAVSKVIKHPQYDSVNNDLALLRLEHVVPATRYIAPLCLPYESHYMADIFNTPLLYTAGWGLNMLGQPAQFKMKTPFAVENFANCQKKYLANAVELKSESHTCAVAKKLADNVFLDSGGALMSLTKIGKQQAYFLVAVDTLNYEEALQSGFPGVFTHISGYLDWIKREISGNLI